MNMNKVWHIIGVMYDETLCKDILVDYSANDCGTIYDAIRAAEEEGLREISGAFLSATIG